MRKEFGKFGILEVSVIALILVAILLLTTPILVGDGPYRPTQCLSNLKQFATASSIYMADFDNHLMDRDKWMDVLLPYVKSTNVERCPAVWEESGHDPHLYGYSFNSKLSHVDGSRIARPEQVPLAYDSINLGRNASDPVTSLPDPPRIHLKRSTNQMAYLDGHVKALVPSPARP